MAESGNQRGQSDLPEAAGAIDEPSALAAVATGVEREVDVGHRLQATTASGVGEIEVRQDPRAATFGPGDQEAGEALRFNREMLQLHHADFEAPRGAAGDDVLRATGRALPQTLAEQAGPFGETSLPESLTSVSRSAAENL